MNDLDFYDFLAIEECLSYAQHEADIWLENKCRQAMLDAVQTLTARGKRER